MLNKRNYLVADKATRYTEARRYGRITIDSEFEVDNTWHRLITIVHHGYTTLFHLYNGNVVGLQEEENE